MSNRETKVVLTAQVAGYLSGLGEAQRATEQTAEAAARAEAQLQKQHGAMTTLGVGLTAFGAVTAAAIGLAVSKYAEFDAQMSSVQAATHETADNMALLREAAVQAGASTAFSATEAAQAIEELAKAGVATADILGGGLKGALDLAAAGQLEVGEAAEIAATAMTQFKLEGSQVPHIADLLAAGAGKAQGSVQDLSQALNQGGLVASQAGFAIEETTGTLAAFAAAGLVGSDAGTSLKTAILALQNPSVKSAETMKQYGIEVYNADGTMKSFAEIAGVLQGSLGGLTDEQRNAALATIFGNDAVRSANVLYANGTAGITDWTTKVNDAGFAAETAAIKQNNLIGDLEKLGGAFDTLLIRLGAGADGPLRALVQSITEVVDAFSEAPPALQQTALVATAVASATALAGGAFLVAVPKVYELKVALDVLATSSMPGVAGAASTAASAVTRTGTALGAMARFLTGPYGVALVATSVALMALKDVVDEARASTEEYQNAIATGASTDKLFELADQGRFISYLDDATSSVEAFQGRLNTIATSDFGTGLNLSTQQLKKSLTDIGDELGKTADSDLPAAQASFRGLATEMQLSASQQTQLLDAMPGYREALERQATAAGVAADDTSLLALAQGTSADQASDAASKYIEQADATDDISDSIRELIDSFNELNGINQDAVSANAEYQESLAGISDDVQRQKDEFVELQKDGYEAAHGSLDGYIESLDGFSLSLDENTVAGATNAAGLSGVARSAQEAAVAQFDVDKTTMSAKAAADKYAVTLADQRQKFIDSAVQAGYNAGEVQKLADKVFALPSSKQVEVLAATAGAQQDLDAFITRNNGRVITVRQQLITQAIASGAAPGEAKAAYQADGGAVRGAGGPRQDNIPIWASVGEHMFDAKDVDAMGGQGNVYEFRRRLKAGDRPRFADGGAIGEPWQSTRYSAPPSAPIVNVTTAAPTQTGPLVGSVTWQSSGSTSSDLDQLEFYLRSKRRGGR